MRARNKLYPTALHRHVRQRHPCREQFIGRFPRRTPVLPIGVPPDVGRGLRGFTSRRLVKQLNPPCPDLPGTGQPADELAQRRVPDQLHDPMAGELGVLDLAELFRIIPRIPR